MEQEQWKRVYDEKSLEEGQPVSVEIGEKQVLLMKHKGKVCACGNSCTHYGAELSDGNVKDGVVTCPWHNARFDVRSGKVLTPPALDDLPTYEVKIEDDGVYLGKKQDPRIEMPTGHDDRHIIIVGAGAAGNAAAETLRREGFAGGISLISAEADPPYDRPALSKAYLSGMIPAKYVPLRSWKFYQRLNIDLLLEHRVTGIDPERKMVHFQSQKPIDWDMILLATGGRPKVPNIPGVDSHSCYMLRSFADSKAIKAAAEDVKHATIIGAGFIGMEVAASLRESGLTVEIVAPEQIPMASVLGPELGKRLQSLHQDAGTRFTLGSGVERIEEKNGTVTVTVKNGTSIETDLVVIGTGIDPVTDYLNGSGIVENGVVPVNSSLQTAVPGIYAAGDIALYPDNIFGRDSSRMQRVEHWVAAEKQGIHAAKAMLGNTEPFSELPFFWTRQHGVSIKYIGFAPDADRIVYRGNPAEGPVVAGYFKDSYLRAVAGLQANTEVFLFGEIIASGKTVQPEDFKTGDINELCLME